MAVQKNRCCFLRIFGQITGTLEASNTKKNEVSNMFATAFWHIPVASLMRPYDASSWTPVTGLAN